MNVVAILYFIAILSIFISLRYKKLSFEIEQDAVIHGLGGYFESQLYGEHMISINPQSFSEGMFSWFPLYM